MKYLAIILLLVTLPCFGQSFSLRDEPFIAQSFTPDTNAASYFNAIKTNGGTITLRQKVAVNNFVLAAKAHGYWTNITDCSPMAGSNTNAAVVKLVNHPNSQSSLLQVYAGDKTNYSESVGWTLNGAKYIWPGLVLSNSIIVSSNCFVGIWAIGQITNGRSWLFGSDNTGVHTYSYMFSGWNSPTWAGQAGVGGDVVQLLNDGTHNIFDQGFVLINRTNINAQQSWVNGYPWGTNNGTITTTNSDKTLVWCLGGRYNAAPPIGAPGTLSGNWILSFYAIGTGFSDSASTNFYRDVLALQQGLGRVPPVATRKPGILILGQSNAYGAGAPPPLQSASRFGNISTLGNAATYEPGTQTNFMFQRIRATEVANLSGWQAFSDELSYLSRTYGGGITNDCIFGNFAKNGTGIGGLTTNTAPYIDSTNWFKLQNDLQTAQSGLPLRPLVLLSVHGENDSGNSSYGTSMTNWQYNYQNSLNSFNGDSFFVPMFHSQIDSYTSSGINIEYVNDQLLSNHENCNGTTNILVMPKYQLMYNPSDGIHVTNTMQMGEQYAWAVYKFLSTGKFDPVRPISIIESSTNQITCTFTGVVSQLVFDSTNSPWLTQTNHGFSYTDSSTPPAITNVVLQSSNQVLITLNGTINGKSGRTLSYAHNATTNATACGTSVADGGNLRDDNPEKGFTTTSNLWNWCVHFQKTF